MNAEMRRRMAAEYIHSYALTMTDFDAKKAARVTDATLATLDNELEASGESSPRIAGEARSTSPAQLGVGHGWTRIPTGGCSLPRVKSVARFLWSFTQPKRVTPTYDHDEALARLNTQPKGNVDRV